MTPQNTRRERPADDTDAISQVRQRLGQRLRDLRVQEGLTQQDMGELTGFAFEGVGRIERGTQEPRFVTLYRFSRALRLTLAELLDFDRLPAPTTHRADVEAVASLLDDKSPSKVAKVRALLELVFDDTP
jgi:transcriptional regulator with XRE-family HTH domain